MFRQGKVTCGFELRGEGLEIRLGNFKLRVMIEILHYP